ncbi:hypothetical protein [Thalassobacillus pellis]|uniref:hypothetical protein n=1 Tax=Thalassobacillus pellis TaxID=748008 RepID=UPI00195FFC5D|nr:hypothetical protein [Thalassobacillus pellis]MBM7552664.1 hypothetical protein [Thalassobacillus pellis]
MSLSVRVETDNKKIWETADLFDETNRTAEIHRLFQAAYDYYRDVFEDYHKEKAVDNWLKGLENLIKQAFHIAKKEVGEGENHEKATLDVALELLIIYITDHYKIENKDYDYLVDHKETLLNNRIVIKQDDVVRFDEFLNENNEDRFAQEITRYERYLSALVLSRHPHVQDTIKRILDKLNLP